jgi:two-component system, OmpR family, response regulator
MSGGTKVLVVDDDPDLRALICDYLCSAGLDARGAADAAEMDASLAAAQFGCIVLDLMMPGEDGLSVLRRLKRPERPGIIMLSAIGTDIDRIVGLELGADDYLSKPCNPRELLARIRAVLRRAEPPEGAAMRTFGPWTLDVVQRQVVREGKASALTDSEFRVLNALLDHPQVLLSRDRLIDLAKGADSPVFDRAIDVTISRLRRKLGPDAPLQTVRNEGYCFTGSVGP